MKRKALILVEVNPGLMKKDQRELNAAKHRIGQESRNKKGPD